MEINSKGIVKSELSDYLNFWVVKLREVFGSNFVIKKEGVVDNIATAGSLSCLALEDVMMYLSKQMNPYTAEGEWQDALYSLVGLTRNYATFTITTRTIEGTPNLVCEEGSIRFKNSTTDDIFELNATVTLDANGKGIGSFTAIELGSIELEDEETLEIIDAPEGVNGIYYDSGNFTTVGDDYEDDSEFRNRWLMTNSVKSGNTEGGMYAALLPLCDNNKNNLLIRQNRATQVYGDFGLHTMNIVIKTAEDNTTIANTIFNNLMDGVGLYGSVSVTVKDLSGENVVIKFDKASGLRTYFKVELVLKEGFILAQVLNEVKKAITDNFKYAMGERIVANDFYQYINDINGIDYVTILKISSDGINWVDTLNVNYNKYGTIDNSDITITEAE